MRSSNISLTRNTYSFSRQLSLSIRWWPWGIRCREEKTKDFGKPCLYLLPSLKILPISIEFYDIKWYYDKPKNLITKRDLAEWIFQRNLELILTRNIKLGYEIIIIKRFFISVKISRFVTRRPWWVAWTQNGRSNDQKII